GRDGIEADDVVDLLGSLVARSLVLSEVVAGHTRFRLLETIRQYAQERLDAAGGTASARDSHAWFFMQLAEHTFPHLAGLDEIAWLERLLPELDNLSAALSWAIDTADTEAAVRLMAACDGPNVYLSEIGGRLRPLSEAVSRLPGAAAHPGLPAVLLQAA